MVKDDVANFIIHDLALKTKVQDGYGVNSGIISDVVEGWNRKVYIVPNKALRLNHIEHKKYILM